MKEKSSYILSIRAEHDIKEIALYTIHNFGLEQSKKYAEGLKTLLNELNSNPDLGKEYWATDKKILFRYRFKAHMIFYYPTYRGIFVVRVLGEMMDFPRHIK